jgi:cyclophilin family peptidyl-prolyl cis-trans isomerase
MTRRLVLMLAALLCLTPVIAADKAPNPLVRLTTSLGVIEIELYPDKAPVTVKNFIAYVESGFYNGTIFHRVMPGFMIQGGGMLPGMKEKPTRPPIINEADNGLSNTVGTIAMARTMEPHSASAQFFINVANNRPLDHTSKTLQGWGYAVFGKVTKGMDVANKIVAVETRTVEVFIPQIGQAMPHENVPAKDIVITRAEIIRGGTKKK